MSRFFSSKKRLIAAGISVAVVLGGGIGAYAYFTTSASGTGSAAVGTDTPMSVYQHTITYSNASSDNALVPGTDATVTFRLDNPSSGHQLLGTVYLADVHACSQGSTWSAADSQCEDNSTSAVTSEITTCESVDPGNAADAGAGDFYMADVVSNQDFGHGNAQDVTASGTLVMNDLHDGSAGDGAGNQDSCKNAALFLDFATR